SWANFVMIDLQTPERVNLLTAQLLQRGVIIRPLAAFGLAHCVRVSVGTPEENEFFLDTFAEVLARDGSHRR
ncbi:MAG: histidinol-phosphate transaminase, partial [Cyanobacteria bacterium REEB65]|nr:histidinol-phosphate transaminase [Cyanobacteria bacterium REEB65]